MADDEQSEDGRNETPLERLDRHWGELLQELRVVQTGIQLLTGFLLTLPFQQKFATLGDPERSVYLAAVSCSIVATGFLEAPVAVHRAVFRRHRRKETVQFAHRLAMVGIVFLALAIIGVATLIFDVLLGRTGGAVAGAIAAALLAVLWLAIPIGVRTRELS
jgi:energy-converting hydrogenase Eha subunit A